MTFMSHVYSDTMTGRIILVTLQNLQIEAGTESLLLTNQTVNIPYLSPAPSYGWIVTLRNFMKDRQISLQFAQSWNFIKSCRHDKYIMDEFL